MSRNLVTQTVRRFRGINVFSSFPNTTPDQATDCLNVIPSGSGGLEKLRIPQTLSSPIAGQSNGPDSFAQFIAAAGFRQVLAQLGTVLGFYDTGWNFTQIDADSRNAAGIYDYVTANNHMFAVNGTRKLKWDGTAGSEWGLDPPASAPVFSIGAASPPTPVAIAAASTPVPLTGTGTAFRSGNIVTVFCNTPHGFNFGDTVEIAGITDASFNGIVTIIEVTTPSDFTYANNGPDAVVSGGGTATDYTQSGVSRIANQVQVITTAPHLLNIGDPITISGLTDVSFNGNTVVDNVLSPTVFTYLQTGPTAFDGGGTMTPRNTAPTYTLGGRRYRISYVAADVTGEHVSSASDISAATGNLDGTIEAIVTGPASPDPQVTGAILWATVDGGGDFYFDQEITTAPGAPPIFQDTVPDAQLDTAILAPLINDPPPVGKYVTRWNGRVFVLNLVGDPQGVAYSGFERILIGRPEESFPPNNRLKLAIGSDNIRGAGALTQGLVIFSQSNEMWLLSGQLQDVTVDAPVQLSAFLRQLPWSQGCFSHYSIAETPLGLVWLASDKSIQVFNGVSAPQSLSTAFNPILRRINSGSETNVRAAFFNFLEREWYALACAIDGSAANNLMVIVDLEPDAGLNAGAFLFSIEADHVAPVEDAAGGRQLVISNSGLMKNLLILSDTVNGISNPITATSGTLGAYWRSGVWGNDNPDFMKMFRWARVVTDQSDFRVQCRMIGEDDEFRYPHIIEFEGVSDFGRFSINEKARRMIQEIKFPDSDVSANLLELSNTYIPLAER